MYSLIVRGKSRGFGSHSESFDVGLDSVCLVDSPLGRIFSLGWSGDMRFALCHTRAILDIFLTRFGSDFCVWCPFSSVYVFSVYYRDMLGDACSWVRRSVPVRHFAPWDRSHNWSFHSFHKRFRTYLRWVIASTALFMRPIGEELGNSE
jgi:hypothetical protein